METFDVIIVGGGPAGLICAKSLANSDLSVLLIEKDTIFGDKVCAGGLTRKDLPILSLPDEMIGQKVYHTALHSVKRKSQAITPDPVVVTIDRKVLGEWQASLLDNSHVRIWKGKALKEVKSADKTLSRGEEARLQEAATLTKAEQQAMQDKAAAEQHSCMVP